MDLLWIFWPEANSLGSIIQCKIKLINSLSNQLHIFFKIYIYLEEKYFIYLNAM